MWMAQSWEDESKMPLGQILDFQNLHYCKPAKEAHFQVLIFNKCITELHKVQCFEHSGLKKRQEGTKSKERGGRNANSKKSFLSLSSFALISSGSVRSLGGSSVMKLFCCFAVCSYALHCYGHHNNNDSNDDDHHYNNDHNNKNNHYNN